MFTRQKNLMFQEKVLLELPIENKKMDLNLTKKSMMKLIGIVKKEILHGQLVHGI